MADQLTPAAADQKPVAGTNESSPTVTPAKKPRSRWWRYSIRALLLFQVVIAVFVGYVVWRVRGIERQHVAAKEIGDFNKTPSRERPVEPVWFWEPACRLCGSEQTTDILQINAHNHPLKVTEIESLPYLESLSMTQGVESAAVMEIIRSSKCLKQLYLHITEQHPISDEVLAQLNGNRSIEKLTLNSWIISDQCVAKLADMPNVTSLSLDPTKSTIAALDRWIEKNRLRSLTLSFKPNADDIHRLSKLTSLERLHVSDIDVDVVAELGVFPNLKNFSISANRSAKVLQQFADRMPSHIVISGYSGKSFRGTQ